VGCATGGFLCRAREAGFAVRGAEISAAAAAAARQRHDLAVDTGDVRSLPLPAASFAVLTLWDVIEHVPRPRELMRRAAELLRPGGLLFLSTGDVGSPWARACGRFWPLMTPPQHLTFHTRASIGVLVAQAGLELVEVTHPGRHVNLGLIALKARESFGAAFAPASAAVRALRLERAALYLNLGDVMTVVAAKPGPRAA
jgi:SAM-dependent methyltransferase